MLVIQVLGRLRQEDFCKFKGRLCRTSGVEMEPRFNCTLLRSFQGDTYMASPRTTPEVVQNKKPTSRSSSKKSELREGILWLAAAVLKGQKAWGSRSHRPPLRAEGKWVSTCLHPKSR